MRRVHICKVLSILPCGALTRPQNRLRKLHIATLATKSPAHLTLQHPLPLQVNPLSVPILPTKQVWFSLIDDILAGKALQNYEFD